jgi:ribosome maturation factor RimP
LLFHATLPGSGLSPLFLRLEAEVVELKPKMTEIQERIDKEMSGVEVLAVEQPGGGTLRLLIDHPGGVTLETCREVTEILAPLREEFALEVSSPGPNRPLTRPDHYQRFEGRRVKIRTTTEIDGRKNVTGTILGSNESVVTIGFDDQLIEIPLEDIERSNLAPEKGKGASR